MVQLNLALREINCKVVYFGCGLSGKTTNLEVIHQKASPDSRGELTSIATESDRTLFFDFMPLDLGSVSGMKVKFQLYTVPGQVYYNSTRKLVLRGADGVIFVADSNPAKAAENLESFENLQECLKEQGRSLDEMPYVVQFNKRDLPDAATLDAMRVQLKLDAKAPVFEACAARGDGVLETFKALAGFLLERVKNMSTDSAAKPTVQQQRMTAKPEPQKPVTGAERLQGGMTSVAPASTPSKLNTQTLDRRNEPAPAAANASSAAPAARPAAVAAPPAVRPSVRASAPISEKPASPPARPATSAKPAPIAKAGMKPNSPAGGSPITTSNFKTLGTNSMMVCSSSRRRKSPAKAVGIIIAVGVALAAAAFAYLKLK